MVARQLGATLQLRLQSSRPDDAGRLRTQLRSCASLVDSGASHTVLDHRFAKRFLTNLTSSNLRLAWLGSKDNDTKEGVLSNIQIGNYFRNGPYRAHVLNLDAINHAPARLRTLRMDGILGADFFIAHGAMIDYRDDSLKFNAAPDGWMEPPRISVR